MHLWDEEARIVIYVKNILSHSALGFKTPEEMYTGKKPEVSHLKIFGCLLYVPSLKKNLLSISTLEIISNLSDKKKKTLRSDNGG